MFTLGSLPARDQIQYACTKITPLTQVVDDEGVENEASDKKVGKGALGDAAAARGGAAARVCRDGRRRALVHLEAQAGCGGGCLFP